MTDLIMYDSTRPGLIPAGAEYIAIYGNGRFAADRATVKRQFPSARIYSIDVLNTDPAGCGIADVENGDMTPADVPGWVQARLGAHPGVLCRIYCNRSNGPAVKDQVAMLPAEAREQVRYWIADPTGTPHMVPGADATQWLWAGSWDESLLDPAFIGSD